jgi:hypothetical protein
VTGVSVPQIASALDCYFNLEQKERKVISQEAESMGKRSHPDQAKKHLQ